MTARVQKARTLSAEYDGSDGVRVGMVSFRGAAHLSAPRLSELALQTLIDVLADPDRRAVLARFLHHARRAPSDAEYYAQNLGLPLDVADVARHLVELRHGGWLHQRPTSYGLLSRLRLDDLELRFPDTMRSLHPPEEMAGHRGSELARIEVRLRELST